MQVLKKITLFLFVFSLLAIKSYSQEILNGNDLSQVRVDKLTDADILKFQQQLKASGLSIEEAQRLAISKGLPPAELLKLKNRLSAINPNMATEPVNKTGTESRQQTGNEVIVSSLTVDDRIFGATLFSSTSSVSFQPDLKIATPVNYQLGPDDQLQIAVYGIQEGSFNLTVSPEGSIFIPNVGEIQVSGMTVEAARDKIRQRMSTIYRTLGSGGSKLSISLGKIRSIRVTVLGSNKPGTFTVSSLSTVFNALYLSGGPSLNGSYREIELLRENRIVKKIDLYSFLLSGSEADNVRLQENDIIRIPVYKNRVEIVGEVKRPGIFEILPGETFNNLLYFASGFTDSAYKASVKVIQLTETDRRIRDLNAAEYSSYHPNTGDYFTISRILNRIENKITVEGAVVRPGNFELTNNLTLSQLIRKADGLREDAYMDRGQIVRINQDLSAEIIPFNIKSVMNGTMDFPLQRDDRIIISSIFDLSEETTVFIQGEIRKPATYKYIAGLSLKDVILQAGGFTDAAYPQRIEIARIIKRDTLTRQDKRLSQIISVNDVSDLSLSANNVRLEPFDVITIRRLPGYLLLQSVNTFGQLQFPGPYVLQNRSERISDLVKRAGGLTPEAFPDAAYLHRSNIIDIPANIKATTIAKIQEGLRDTAGQVISSTKREYDQIPLNLRKIMSYPGSEEDLILKAGDALFVPRNDQAIKISGEVLFPTQMPYNNNKSLKDYISDAGGFTDNARRKRIYVINANGKAISTHNFLFVRNYPAIRPGAEIIVPKYIPKERVRRTATEIVALSSAVASLAYIVFSIFKK